MLELLAGLIGPPTEASDQRTVQGALKWRLKFYNALAARYDMNQSFMRTVSRLSERKSASSPSSQETRILSRWAERMEHDGDDLDIILRGYVPDDELQIISAALSGASVKRAAWLVEKKLAQQGMLMTALLVPAIHLLMLIGMLMVIGYMVMPNIIAIQIRQGAEPSQSFVFLATHAWLLPIPFVVLILAIRHSLPRMTGEHRIWLDHHVWPWTQFRRTQGVAFLLSYAAMWRSGLTDLEALFALAENGMPWLRERISAIAHWVEDGNSLGDSMQKTGFGFPDPDIIEDIGDIETTPEETARHIEMIAEREQRALQEQFRTIATITSILVMVMVGVILVVVVSSILTSLNIGALMNSGITGR